MFLNCADAVDLYGKRFSSIEEADIVNVLKGNGLPFSFKTLTEEVFGIVIEKGDSFQDVADKVKFTSPDNRGFIVNGFLILKKTFFFNKKKITLNIRYGSDVNLDFSNLDDESITDLLEGLMKDQTPHLEGLKEKVCETVKTISQNLRDQIAYQSALLKRQEFNVALHDLRNYFEISSSQAKILNENRSELSEQERDLLDQVEVIL